MRIPDYVVSSFGGLNTFIKDKKTLKPGIATDSLNWLTAKQPRNKIGQWIAKK